MKTLINLWKFLQDAVIGLWLLKKEKIKMLLNFKKIFPLKNYRSIVNTGLKVSVAQPKLIWLNTLSRSILLMNPLCSPHQPRKQSVQIVVKVSLHITSLQCTYTQSTSSVLIVNTVTATFQVMMDTSIHTWRCVRLPVMVILTVPVSISWPSKATLFLSVTCF